MRKRFASLQDRVREIWFGDDSGPDSLLARSFRACEDCGENVYILATSCRECGAELELLAS
ncbi:hypothetical protein [Haloechinothrix halophila]|uniref:hypothetical protein n=1 Tax=Haloechinothrix halophila TaxID=1069073 RepID=UPI0003F55AA3|nr:hypothetical protein [Haloechinothrix halophila]